jgi:branched-chain amino acid transport system substrate-binding protein
MRRAVAALAVLGVIGASAACASSSGSTAGVTAGPGGTKIVTLGLQTALTGPLASSFGSGTVEAAQARIDLANATDEIPGVKLKLVTADENNSPQGALQATQNLTQSKGALAILAAGPFFFGSYRYTVRQNIPVFGIGIDGPEWSSPQNKNLFAYEGSTNPSYPSYSGMPQYFKSKGVTRFCALSYGGTAASQDTAQAMIASVKRAGIDIAYQNLNVPLGGTDFGADALAIKNAHCNALATWFVVSSDIALFQALKDIGITGSSFKASFITGVYGQDLLNDPAAREAAQGYGVGTVFEPASLKTTGTKQMMAALSKYAGYKQSYPLSSAQWGWFTADLAIYAIKKAGKDLSQQNVISTMRRVTDYNAGGMLCPVDFTRYDWAATQFAANCAWVATVQGDNFVSSPQPVKMAFIPGTSNGGA